MLPFPSEKHQSAATAQWAEVRKFSIHRESLLRRNAPQIQQFDTFFEEDLWKAF